MVRDQSDTSGAPELPTDRAGAKGLPWITFPGWAGKERSLWNRLSAFVLWLPRKNRKQGLPQTGPFAGNWGLAW